MKQWNITFCQQAGTGEMRNQDALFNGQQVFQYKLKKAEQICLAQETLVLAVADGVSSSPQSQLASRYFMQSAKNCEKLTACWLREQQVRFAEAYSHRYFGCATTFVGVQLFADNRCHIVNVGDSSAFRITKQGEWQKLSYDHILLNELVNEQSPYLAELASLYFALSDCLVADPLEQHFRIFSQHYQLEQGDYLLLCSDGFTNDISEAERQRIWQLPIPITEKLTLYRQRVKQHRFYDDLSIVLCEI